MVVLNKMAVASTRSPPAGLAMAFALQPRVPSPAVCPNKNHAFGRGQPITRCPCLAETASTSGDAPDRDLFPVPMLKYRRVMLKLSGEALQGENGWGIDPKVLTQVAKEVTQAASAGVQVAIVVGGGNFFRGVSRWDGLERVTADFVGMLATVMNALTLQSALESLGVPTRVQTAIEMREVAEPYIRRRAIRHLERGRVVIFGGGTGNPFFTTDTAAALRAAEVEAEAFLKATKVDGIYDSDPQKNPNATLYTRLSFGDCTKADLKVMDETAFTLCKENSIPVIVFNVMEPGNILKALMGGELGTYVSAGEADRLPQGLGSRESSVRLPDDLLSSTDE